MIKIQSQIRATFMALLSASVLAACQTAAPELTAEEEQAIYMERFNGLRSGELVAPALYSPRAMVPGAADYTPLPDNPDAPIAKDAIAKVEAYAEANNSTALFIWQGDGVVHETYFQGTDAASFVNSKSLAKPLSVIAIGRAIEEGFIDSLDQSAADFITEWQGTEKAEIKVRYLLDMRTGLLPQGFNDDPDDVLNLAYLHPRHEEIIIADYPLTHPPGSRYEYSNATSQLVAVVIERATGVRYEDWVSQEILQPIGALGGEIWLNREGGTAHSGCCILLPAETYLRLAVLLIKDGTWGDARLLPEGYVAEMRTATPQNPHAGMGVYVAGQYISERGTQHPDKDVGKVLHSEPYLAADLFLFDGNGHQAAYIIPSADLIIFRSGAWPTNGERWDHTMIPNTILRGIEFADGRTIEPQPR